MSLVTSAVKLHSVLIATDFSPASEKPLRHALAIARRYGAKLYLTHVVSSLGLTMVGPDAIAVSEEAVCRDAVHLQDELVRSGSLTGLQYQIVIRQGEVWRELEEIIRQEEIDLVVLGTHGRHSLGKLLLGSVAEQIFRHSDCLVLTVGPSAYRESRIDSPRPNRTFLFATDFGEASLRALPFALSCAQQFEGKLVLLHIVPPVEMPKGVHRGTASDLMQMRENARLAGVRRLEELTRNAATLDIRPEFLIEFGAAAPVSEQILEVAARLGVDLIIMGLHRSSRIGTASHMPWATAYEVVCRAGCPVLTVRQ